VERDGIFLKGNIVTVIAINSFFAETFSFSCLSVENNVSLQDNSDDHRRIRLKWRYAKNGKRMKQEPRGEIKTCPFLDDKISI
jgi:hypothetical protein